ncbi:MAG: hypothetical protein ACPG7F_02900 [Aggregatilineales bacterium]
MTLTHKILVVGDERDVVELYAYSLKARSYDIHQLLVSYRSKTFEEHFAGILAIHEKQHFDLVFIYCFHPSIELLKLIREQINTPVVIYAVTWLDECYQEIATLTDACFRMPSPLEDIGTAVDDILRSNIT